MKNEYVKRDQGISFIRVASMFMIIATHFFSAIEGLAFIGQITNASIYTFLLISAYLFSKKNISNPRTWIIKRLKTILIPMYFYLIILFAYQMSTGEFDVVKSIIYLFNLQGILGTTAGASHFWFMTIIMLCYLITPLLNMYKDKFIESTSIQKFINIFLIITVWLLSAYVTERWVGFDLRYLAFYSIAYLLFLVTDRKMNDNKIIILAIIVLILQFFRLVARFKIDGTFIYNVVLVPVSNGFLGIFLFFFLYRLDVIYRNKRFIKVINHFDRIAYEMFITHYAFIVGPFTIWGTFDVLIVNILLVMIATYVSASLLKFVSNYALSRLNHTAR